MSGFHSEGTVRRDSLAPPEATGGMVAAEESAVVRLTPLAYHESYVRPQQIGFISPKIVLEAGVAQSPSFVLRVRCLPGFCSPDRIVTTV